jgi:two-component system, OmpR family, response regulator
MAKILMLEDEQALADIVIDWLTSQNYMVDHVNLVSDAKIRLKMYQYDLVILDVNLPDGNGVEVCRDFRTIGGRTPVLMLTGRSTVQEKALGLDSGADDYLTKPFHMDELAARVRALLRRPTSFAGAVLKFADLELNTSTHRVTKGSQEIQLLPKEFALLEFLMKHSGQVFSAEALIERIWPTDSDASPDAIRIYITRLRNKIDTKGEQSLISTMRGVGYRLG